MLKKIKNKVVRNGVQAKTRIQNDGFAALEKAQSEKVIQVKKASETSYNWAYGKNPNKAIAPSGMSESELRQKQKTDEVFDKSMISYEDRMKQESPFAGVSEEKIQKYADQIALMQIEQTKKHKAKAEKALKKETKAKQKKAKDSISKSDKKNKILATG